MPLPVLFVFISVLVIIELIYFKIADKFNIIDHPNHRSSHTKITIRGGGIIFTIGFLLGCVYFGWNYNYFLAALLLMTFVSFLDDVKTTSKRVRIAVHLIAVALLFYQLGIYHLPFYWILLGFVVVIGTINAVNFMDGINGITGGYGLVTLYTLFYINNHIVLFTNGNYFIAPIIALLVFDFFNFRKRAKCFAGDVGSVSLAFIILFFLLQLIIKTNSLTYLLLLLIYGVDVVTTILFRIFRKENVFEAHRSHFYQFLANEKKMSHLSVALTYMLLQCLVNVTLMFFFTDSVIKFGLIVAVAFTLFIVLRLSVEGSRRLLKTEA